VNWSTTALSKNDLRNARLDKNLDTRIGVGTILLLEDVSPDESTSNWWVRESVVANSHFVGVTLSKHEGLVERNCVGAPHKLDESVACVRVARTKRHNSNKDGCEVGLHAFVSRSPEMEARLGSSMPRFSG